MLHYIIHIFCYPKTASTTDPSKIRFHRPQHLKVVRETIPPTDANLSSSSSTGQVRVYCKMFYFYESCIAVKFYIFINF